MPQKGDRAPVFALNDEDGNEISLASFSGKKVVLYFYPKDDTPGCTTEACAFRDAYDEILATGAVVIGVSPDTADRHAKFKSKYGLPFHLLADPEKTAIKAYGAWGEKSMYGKKYEGVIRSTFVIGPDGIITAVFPKVSPKGHAAEILETLRS